FALDVGKDRFVGQVLVVIIRTVCFTLQLGELFGGIHIEVAAHGLRPVEAIERYGGFTGGTAFGGDEDNAVGRPGAVDGLCRRILKDLDGGNVVGVDVVDAADGNAVGNDDGGVARRE